MLEIMVAGLCLNGAACDEALRAYYHQNVNLQSFSKHTKNKIVEVTGKEIVFILPVTYAMMADKKYTIAITKNWSFTTSKNNNVFSYRYDF